MRLKTNIANRHQREPDLTSLINIVFLILIFLLVAGTFRPFSARDIKLATVSPESADAVSRGVLIVHSDGRIVYQGSALTLANLAAAVGSDTKIRKDKPFTIVADARVEGHTVLQIIRTVRSVGFTSIALMTERKRQ